MHDLLVVPQQHVCQMRQFCTRAVRRGGGGGGGGQGMLDSYAGVDQLMHPVVLNMLKGYMLLLC